MELKPITFDEGVSLATQIGAASYVECSSLHVLNEHVFIEATNVLLFTLSNKPADSKCLLQ